METQVLSRKPYPTDVSDEEWAFVAPVSDLMTRGRPAAPPRPARGLQRAALDRARRRPVAHAADRLPAVGGGLPADPALAGRRACFEAMVHDLRALLRWSAGRADQPDGGHFRQRHAAIDAGERAPRRLRRAQAAQGQQDPRWPSIRWATCWPLHVTPANAQDRAQVAALAAAVQDGHRADGGSGLRRPGLHRGAAGRRRGRARHPPGGRQAAGGQARLRAAAPALGRGALLRLGGALPPLGQRLRTLARRWRGCILSPLPCSRSTPSVPSSRSSDQVPNRL